MRFTILSAFICTLVIACGGPADNGADSPPPRSMVQEEPEEVDPNIAAGKGIGQITEVALTDPLEEDMIVSGKAIYEMKCAACHKLTDERVVGPGWEGITNRRRPEWIMNMITNVNMMLAKDPTAQALLEECLTRMPNQNISIGDARDLLEYMRQNDVERVGSKDEAVTES